MGGQVGDMGRIASSTAEFAVQDCVAPYKGIHGHVGKMQQGTLKVGDPVKAAIDVERRQKIANNHTATHLLHWALHKVLGEHVKQAGSVVDPQRLRFDFSHHKALTPEEIRAIEDLVNSKIRGNLPVEAYEIGYEEARQKEEIKQFFGEKYGSVVRVIDIDFSKELCGGTHTSAVGNIGYFRIVKEGSIAAGVRRIEAVTGADAEHFARQAEQHLEAIAQTLKIPVGKVGERIEKLLEESKTQAAAIKELKMAQMDGLVDQWLAKKESIKGVPFVVAEVALQPEELKLFADRLMEQMKSGVLLVGGTAPDKCQVIVRVSPEWTAKGIQAGNIIKAIAPIIEGSGGGKADSAQAGGKAPQKLQEALQKARELLAG
jgi:alanyl-tRNA synthetase